MNRNLLCALLIGLTLWPLTMVPAQQMSASHETSAAPPLSGRGYRLGAVQYQENFEDGNWKTSAGEWQRLEKGRRLVAQPTGAALFSAFPHNRVGGSIAVRFRFKVSTTAGDENASGFKLTVNRFEVLDRGAERIGFPRVAIEDAFFWTKGAPAQVRLQERTAPVDWQPTPGREHEITFITVDRYKEVLLDGKLIASRWIRTPWVSSEGTVHIEGQSTLFDLTDFQILQTDWNTETEQEYSGEYSKGELLFSDDFKNEASLKNWGYEHKAKDAGFSPPSIKDGWLRADPYSVAWCRYRSSGPVIYSFKLRALPKAPDRPQSVTDAIFYFQTSWSHGPEDFFSEPHYDDRMGVYTDVNAYWIDFGGNGNATTRLRKLPYRQLLRQSIAPQDMLKPGHVHEIEMICAGEKVRFRVDGRTVLSIIDRQSLQHGHFGVLGFVRPTEISDFRIYRAVPAG